MKNTDSIFYRIQKEGAAALRAFGLTEGFQLDLSPFVTNISNSYNDSFPVFVFDLETAGGISSRFEQIQAAEGLPIEEDLSDDDLRALNSLVTEERFKANIPARRFGVELQSKTFSVALAIEAIKAVNLENNVSIPYERFEISGRKISDCNFFRIYSLYQEQTESAQNSQIILHPRYYYLSISEAIKTGIFAFDAPYLAASQYNLTAVPFHFNRKIVYPSELFNAPAEFIEAYGEGTSKVLSATFDFLWTLQREPKIFKQKIKDFKESNRLRRSMRRPPFSAIHTIDIDADELRRLESHRAEEIAHALATKGGYKIEGLVLVGGHPKPSTGKYIEAYARCADEVVRHVATDLLRHNDFEGLAGRYSEYPRLEVPFFTRDRNEEDQAEVMKGYFDTDRDYLFPMTKAYIKRGWHRVYKLNTATGIVEDVRLLVWPRQDPSYTGRSAHEWLVTEEKRGLIAKEGFCFASDDDFAKGTRPNIFLAGGKLPENFLG
jgi:hypothetical protein